MGHFLDIARSNLDSTALNGIMAVRNVSKSLSHRQKEDVFLSTELANEIDEFTKEGELVSSMRRLEAADVCIAVLDSGEMRVVRTDEEAHVAIDRGLTIYAPLDMYFYVQLEPAERRMLHQFKKRYAATTEWRNR